MRNYIKNLALCAATAYFMSSCNLSEDSVQKKEIKPEIVQKFPRSEVVSMYKKGNKDEIQTKYGTLKLIVNPEDPKLTLVHYKQIHDSPVLIHLVNDYLENKDNENMKIVAEESIKYLGKLNKVHKNISLYHINVYHKMPLYAEGQTKDLNQKDLRNIRAKKVMHYGLFKYPEDENLVKNMLELSKNNPFGFGTELYLGVYKETPILSLESKQITLDDLMEKSYQLNKEKHNELREDGMIKKVVEKSSEFKCRPILLGASHDLKNNVEAYNKQNPDNKLRLIEFNPNGVPLTEEELTNVLGKRFIDAYDSFLLRKQVKLMQKLLKKNEK